MAETDFTLATQAGPSNPLDKQLFLTISRVRETDRQTGQAGRQQQRHAQDGTSGTEKDMWHVSRLTWYLPACLPVSVWCQHPKDTPVLVRTFRTMEAVRRRTNHTILGSLPPSFRLPLAASAHGLPDDRSPGVMMWWLGGATYP